MLSPAERAAQVYEREWCARSFREDLSWHLTNGFVFSRPDFFVMGRPVVAYTAPDCIVGQYKYPSGICDCWHIYLFAGNIARAWDMLPWELPLVSFERGAGNVLRFYRLSSIRRLTSNSL